MTDNESDSASATQLVPVHAKNAAPESPMVCVNGSTASLNVSGRELGYGLLAVPVSGLLIFGAHLLRSGDIWSLCAVLVVVVVGLCVSRQGWGRIVAAAVLFAASFLWVKTGIDFVQVRMMLGQPWVRLAAIMGAVTLFSFVGSVILLSSRARNRFHINSETAIPQAVTFFLIILLLWICRVKAARINLLLADRFLPGSGILEMVLVAIYGAVICGLLLDRKKARRVRPRIWALFSALFFGQLILGLVGVDRMLMTGDLHLPVPALILAGPLFRGSGYFMLILFTVSVLLVGPAWCSHLCYIGAWDDRMSRIGRSAPRALPRWVKPMRWALAATVFAVASGLRLAGMSVFIAAWAAALFGLCGVAVMVLFSSRSGTMVHCSTYCPLGLAGNLLGRLSPWRLRISDACTRCGACLRVCRYNALSPERLEMGSPALSCSLCRDCTTVCSHGAMKLTLPYVSPILSVQIFVVLLATLHAVFIAVARM